LVKDQYCKHVKDILTVERKIIKEHIEEHQWCNSITDDSDAIVDFVYQYAWLMREVFCGVMCPYRDTCLISDEFSRAFLSDISDGEIEKFIKLNHQDSDKDLVKIKLQVLKHDISVHKWLNRIDNYDAAVSDFLNKFGWVIYEIYKSSKEQYKG